EEPDPRPDRAARTRWGRYRSSDRRPRREDRRVARLLGLRADWHRDAPRAQPHHFAVRLVLPVAASRRDLGGRPAVHPVLRQEHGEVAPAVPGRDTSTIIGTGLTAAAQGAILGLAFWI